MRGIRTQDWKYIRYPSGDARPDPHLGELYHISADPTERKNLIKDPSQKQRIAELSSQLNNLIREAGADPDIMPVDEGIKSGLPDQKIR